MSLSRIERSFNMRFTTLLMLAASAAILTGCASTVSIHPLYTSADLVSDLPIEGTWTEQDGEIWQVQKSGDGYDVTVLHPHDTPSTEAFNVHTLRLKNADYIDATSKSQPDLAIAGHLFAKIEVQGDEMRVTLLEEDHAGRTCAAIRNGRGQAHHPDGAHQRPATLCHHARSRCGCLGRRSFYVPSRALASIIADMAKSRDKGNKEVKKPKKKK
jgi:hypothetical protein